MLLNHTHDSAARSWMAAANGHPDFPIQNLPIGVVRRKGSQQAWRGGVAIGDQVLDLGMLAASGALSDLAQQACALAGQETLNAFMASGAAQWQALRHGLFALLRADAASEQQQIASRCLLPQAEVEHALPTRIGDYTDFYTSIHHARNVGQIGRAHV